MSADTFTIKRGDTLPAIQRTLKFDDDSVQDLTGVDSVAFMYAPADPDNCGEPDLSNKVIRVAEVVDAMAGIVKYEWIAADTDTLGEFLAEFEVDFDGAGKRLTFPNGHGEFIKFRVVQDIGDGP